MTVLSREIITDSGGAYQRPLCPVCGSEKSAVRDTRPALLGEVPTLRRRRRCENGHDWYTLELCEADLSAHLRQVVSNVIATAMADVVGDA